RLVRIHHERRIRPRPALLADRTMAPRPLVRAPPHRLGRCRTPVVDRPNPAPHAASHSHRCFWPLSTRLLERDMDTTTAAHPLNARPVNNALYDTLGERWYTAQDDPVALLRAESRLRNPWVIQTLRTH